MAEFDAGGDFAARIDGLEEAMGDASGVVAAFEGEVRQMRETVYDAGREMASFERGLNKGLRAALDGVVKDGDRLSEALQGLGRSIVDAAYATAVNPVVNHVGGALAGGLEGLFGAAMGFAKGGAFTQGRVQPFASGGVVNGPTYFPMRGGTGLMGEAGPEAILPLARGADGRLGVQTSGSARPVQITMNISTPDVAGFQRSRGQIAAALGRAMQQGNRNR